MKTQHLTFISILLAVTFQCTEPRSDSTCMARLKGKVVSQGPICAGVAIQILSGNFDPSRADTLWFDAYVDNPPTYHNVFKIYPYCNAEGEAGQLLLDAIEAGTEFYFIFANNENDPGCNHADHIVCKPLVSLPESTQTILVVTEACNDAIIYE